MAQNRRMTTLVNHVGEVGYQVVPGAPAHASYHIPFSISSGPIERKYWLGTINQARHKAWLFECL